MVIGPAPGPPISGNMGGLGSVSDRPICAIMGGLLGEIRQDIRVWATAW
jgi:hypothetical protein